MARPLLFFLAMALSLLCATAYTPLQIDVDRQGRMLVPRQEGVFALTAEGAKAELVTKSIKGLPIAARWSPGGDKILLAEVMTNTHIALSIVTVADKAVQDLGEYEGLRMPLWSPDGASVSFLLRETPGHALYVVPVAGGDKRKLTGGLGGCYDWVDKGRLVAFRLGQRLAPNGTGDGDVVLIDAGAGAATAVATFSSGPMTPVDASPDGKDVLLVRATADDKMQLVRVTLAAGKVQPVGPEMAILGVWSPDGDRIAVVHSVEREVASQVRPPPGHEPQGIPPGGSIRLNQRVRNLHLSVMKANGADPRTLSDEADNWQPTWSDSPMMPAWIGNQTVLFFRKTPVYGDAGWAVHLTSVKFSGGAAKDLQPAIDAAVTRLLK